MTPFTRQFITTLDPQWREFWAERAAILEYDCKLSREEAEILAWRETSMVMLKYRVAQVAQHQAAQPKPLLVPSCAPVVTGKELAGGVE